MSLASGPSQHAQRYRDDCRNGGSKPAKNSRASVLRSIKPSLQEIARDVKSDIKAAKKMWLPWWAVLCLFVIASSSRDDGWTGTAGTGLGTASIAVGLGAARLGKAAPVLGSVLSFGSLGVDLFKTFSEQSDCVDQGKYN